MGADHDGRYAEYALENLSEQSSRLVDRDLWAVAAGVICWADWFNHQRLHTAIADIPPHEHETNYCPQHQPQPAAGANA
ncbi:MAG: hypothetical protein ACRDP6_12975 [Actinoallomurus sp.]